MAVNAARTVKATQREWMCGICCVQTGWDDRRHHHTRIRTAGPDTRMTLSASSVNHPCRGWCPSLPEALFALLRGELVECFGLLFAQEGLMVVLEAFIVVVVGLSGYLGVLVEDSVFLYRRLALHHDGAQEHGAHQARHVHHFSSLADRTV